MAILAVATATRARPAVALVVVAALVVARADLAAATAQAAVAALVAQVDRAVHADCPIWALVA